MTEDVITATPERGVEEARQLLLKHISSRMPVVDDKEGQAVEIFSETDIIDFITYRDHQGGRLS